VKAQTDETVSCSACRQPRRIPAKYKISHHKRTGPWITPTQCRRCEEGKRPINSANPWLEEDEAFEARGNFSLLPEGIPLESRHIVTDLTEYVTLVRDQLNGGMEPRHTHLAHHMPDSPHSQVGMVVNGQEKSPTAIVGSGCSDVGELLDEVAWLCSQTDRQTSREYQQGVRIARVTDMGNGHVEITILHPNPNGGYVVVTTYDTVTVSDTEKKYRTYGDRTWSSGFYSKGR